MKEYSTSQRLKQIMDIKKMRQVDILHAAEPYCKRFGPLVCRVKPFEHRSVTSGIFMRVRPFLKLPSAVPKPGLWGMMSAWKEA